jgi:hypothetical protein
VCRGQVRGRQTTSPTQFAPPTTSHPSSPRPPISLTQLTPRTRFPTQLSHPPISPTQLTPPDHLANPAHPTRPSRQLGEVVHSRPGYPQARSTRPGCRSLLVDWQGGTPPGSGGGCIARASGISSLVGVAFGAASTRGRCLRALADWVVLLWLFLSPWVRLRRLLAGGAGLRDGLATGLSGKGWLPSHRPSYGLSHRTEGAQFVLWAGFCVCGPPRSGVIRLRQVDGMATSPRGVCGLAPSSFIGRARACLGFAFSRMALLVPCGVRRGWSVRSSWPVRPLWTCDTSGCRRCPRVVRGLGCLITRAPRPASNWVAYGPASAVVSSPTRHLLRPRLSQSMTVDRSPIHFEP